MFRLTASIALAGLLLGARLGAADADQAGGRSGAPVTTGQNRTFSDPINRPVPPMSTPVQRGTPLYPRHGSQQRTR